MVAAEIEAGENVLGEVCEAAVKAVDATIGASKARPSRTERMAIPCSAIAPESRMRSPGRARRGEISMPSAIRPMPAVLM